MKLPQIKAGLQKTAIGDELLVYDTEKEVAHCLSKPAALVLECCEKSLTRKQASEILQNTGIDDAGNTVNAILASLAESNLLFSDETSKLGRREVLTALSSLAIAPVLLSVAAPAPAQALSCIQCTFPGTPTCVDCGRTCDLNTGCASNNFCCFEFVYNPAHDVGTGDGTQCINESFSDLTCRSRFGVASGPPLAAGDVYNFDCNTARGQLLALVGPPRVGDKYYCCRCVGAAKSC